MTTSPAVPNTLRITHSAAGLTVLIRRARTQLTVPASWHVRDKIVNNLTAPVPLFFGSTDDLPLVDTVEGDEDIAVEALARDGIAIALVGYDLTRDSSTWLSPTAVATLKKAGAWPYDPAANVGFDLSHPFGLADLAEVVSDAGRGRRVGWFNHRTWCIGVEVWLGPDADLQVVQGVITSLRPV
jgi:hypothetical protein